LDNKEPVLEMPLYN